jgi:indolepyruvate ferredoxin oxidoreductase alpha subunit
VTDVNVKIGVAPVKSAPHGPGEEPGQIVGITGNEAIARGAWEAGVRVAAAYPGTPSTEILESLATYPVDDLHAQWSPNEKVALDVAIGASLGGVRAMAAMKHVGLNVAADALMSQSYIGVNAGLVIAVCDDPGIHSSQNEQDSRYFARFAQIPVLEPSDAQEALELTKLAFELSERFDTPVMLRSTTRLSHTRSPVAVGTRVEPPRRPYRDDPAKQVMIPAYARTRHPLVLEREAKVAAWVDAGELSILEEGASDVGIVTVGMAYSYVKEVAPPATILKLASSYPLPEHTLRSFAASVDRLLVVEELEPVVETALRAMGLAPEGKEYFDRTGELSAEGVRAGLVKANVLPAGSHLTTHASTPMPRPPVLCAGCPHMSTFMAMRALEARVAGDIGCYTLSVIEPVRATDICVSMGSSIGIAAGMARTTDGSVPIFATIGDSTFLHAGLPALMDAVYNRANITVALLDNHTTAMTGGQEHPGTGRTLRGEATHRVDFEQLVRALGVEWVKVVDSYDVPALYQAYREASQFDGVAVVISNRPCVLDPVKIKGPPFEVHAEGCTACQACMNLGCPSITWGDGWYEGRHKVQIDAISCVGCTLCVQVCPTDCIRLVEGQDA